MEEAIPKQCYRCNLELGEHEEDVCLRCLNDPHPEDTEIRQAGFTIRFRSRVGGAIWWRRGRYYSHAKALLIARDRVKK